MENVTQAIFWNYCVIFFLKKTRKKNQSCDLCLQIQNKIIKPNVTNLKSKKQKPLNLICKLKKKWQTQTQTKSWKS